MRVRSVVLSTVATVAMTAAPSGPVAAQAVASISVSPTTVRSGDSVTVTGTTDCPSVAYTVTLTYADPDLLAATTTATGTTDASGEFTQALTVPANAHAGEPATVVASVDCSGGAQQSNEVGLTIQAHEGTLAIDPANGPPGTTVEVTGTDCWGGRVDVVFSDGVQPDHPVDVVLAPDRTFAGSFEVPDRTPGPYAVLARCPGTTYGQQAFRVDAVTEPPLTAPPVDTPPAPPAEPVPGAPTFTG